jgi:DNA-binding Lrp family transcriptional regulator
VNNQGYTLDETDRKIIGLLAGDSRLSYERIGSALNMTRNSIKTRVKRMVSVGVIQEYIADVNLSVLGYNVYYVITKQKEKSSSTESNHITRTKTIEYLDRLGDILAEIEVLGETLIFRVATREAFMNGEVTGKDLINTTALLLETGFIEKVVLASTTKGFKSRVNKKQRQQQQSFLTPTDLKILRCLVLNPLIGITNIANLVSISARTANRILKKLRDSGVVRFSIICNPSLMKGFVVFGLLIYVNDSEGDGRKGEQGKNRRSNSHKVLERLYSESHEYPFLRTPIISHDKIVIVSVFGNDVFAIDLMFKRILSFEEVKKAELYVFTKIKYYKESIVKEIDHILGSRI